MEESKAEKHLPPLGFEPSTVHLFYKSFIFNEKGYPPPPPPL